MKKIMMDEQDMIEFKMAYRAAVKSNLDTFMFQERQVVTTYAKYLIQTLKDKKEVV